MRLSLRRVRIIRLECRYLIALVVKTRFFWRRKGSTSLTIWHHPRTKFTNVSKTDVNNVSWVTIEKFLRECFTTSTKIIVCDNYITIPETSDRNKIIAENHASAIGDHKGIIKTYKRIRHIYFWSGMKLDVQKYLRNAEIVSCKS